MHQIIEITIYFDKKIAPVFRKMRTSKDNSLLLLLFQN
jgi:hypothetical protein